MAKYIVCPRCEGEGTIVNPEVDGNGLTAENFDRDPDFFDDYMSGVYDVQCPACRGNRVVQPAEYRAYVQQESEQREERLLALRESGIYPGHRDYF